MTSSFILVQLSLNACFRFFTGEPAKHFRWSERITTMRFVDLVCFIFDKWRWSCLGRRAFCRSSLCLRWVFFCLKSVRQKLCPHLSMMPSPTPRVAWRNMSHSTRETLVSFDLVMKSRSPHKNRLYRHDGAFNFCEIIIRRNVRARNFGGERYVGSRLENEVRWTYSTRVLVDPALRELVRICDNNVSKTRRIP